MSDIDVLNKAKAKTKELIELGEIELAKGLVEKYKELLKEDVEVYCIRAVIAMIEARMDEAEEILLEGYTINNSNFDILYNLAYLYENIQEYNKSLAYYMKAKLYCNDIEMHKELENKIDDLEKNHNIHEIKVEEIIQRKKIVFFVKQGMDSFLGDIINNLSKDYEIKKIVIAKNEEFKLIDQWMEWADISWFEWCDELVIYGSQLPIAEKKKIISRIHGYEVYTDFIKATNWKNIDQLIIVAPHIRRIFEENTKNIEKGNLKIDTIFCGINVCKYPLNSKRGGYNLGYLGYINYKKNIPLTLDIFKKLHDIDNRYKLHIAGEIQDVRTLEYLRYFIKEHKLQDSFIFHGWLDQNKKIEWFKSIDYMVISSIDEGLCFAAAEAMCSGIKPILHNCEGIKNHYDMKYIFNTTDEAVEMILDKNYNSKEYRKFIEEHYSLTKEINKIREILNSLINPQYYLLEFNIDNEKDFRLHGNYFLREREQLEFYMNPWTTYDVTSTNLKLEIVFQQIQNQFKYISELYFNGESNLNTYLIYFNYLLRLLQHDYFSKDKDITDLLKTVKKKGNLSIDLIERTLLCLYPILRKRFQNTNDEFKVYKVHEEYKNKDFSNKDQLIKELYEKLYKSVKEVKQFIKTFIIHGSLSTLDYTKYSDIDTLIVLKDEVFRSLDYMRICRKQLSEATQYLFEYDPLQHHKFFFVTEMDLLNYSNSYLPVELFEYSTLVYGDTEIEINVRDCFLENLYALWSMAYGFRQAYITKQFPNNLFNLKRYTSRLMLLPTLYLELFYDIYPYKKYSFDLAQKYFTDDEWKAIDIATKLRGSWDETMDIRVNDNFYYYTWKLAERIIDDIYNTDVLTKYRGYFEEEKR